MQSSAIRFELGDNHTYEFVEGVVPWSIEPEAKSLFSDGDRAFAYFDPGSPQSYRTAVAQLDRFITAEGPFDGVMAFSQGAVLAATLLVQKQYEDSAGQHLNPLFKCAIFFSGSIPNSVVSLHGKIPETAPPVESDVGEIIGIPTAHIWGADDMLFRADCERLSKLCRADRKSVYVHDGGHEIPGIKMRTGVVSSVKVIRRAVTRALVAQ